MSSSRLVYTSTVAILWIMALWSSWECRGLFVDGAALLINLVQQWHVIFFRESRLYAVTGGQSLALVGIHLGITDLHRLAQLLSLALFALPTGFYHLALWRARRDPALLAATIAVIAVVFMTTSFFIVGEYNTAFAVTTASAVWLATTDRLRVGEGIALAVIALFFSRTYEVTLYDGPLLALMTLWRINNVPERPRLATILYLAAGAFFLGGGIVALGSLIKPYEPEHTEEALRNVLDFWWNPQFDFTLAATLVVVMWALARPADLGRLRPYGWASILLVILALSPLFALGDSLLRPFARSHYVARTVAGLVVAAFVVLVWFYSSKFHRLSQALILLHRPDVARRFLAFAALMLVASLPANVFLTVTWIDYLDTLRATVNSRSGVIAYEDTPLSAPPVNLLVDAWPLPSQSVIVRSKPGTAVIAPPRGYRGWTYFAPDKAPDLGPYFWR